MDKETIQQGLQALAPGRISGVVVRGGRVGFSLEAGGMDTAEAEALRDACEAALRAMPGVETVTAVLTSERPAGSTTPKAAPEKARPAIWNREPLPGVRHIVAVASGKGGVGKSTSAVNLAVAMMQLGLKVGLLDADIYGPSIPRMLGLKGQPAVEQGALLPLMGHGLASMSIGYITGDENPVVWRGSMVTKALHQMVRGVRWGNLDVLVVDMPPGTGDIHLSLAQGVPLSGAVMVSTPQDIALADATKCVQMLQKIAVPILGMIENMSHFVDPASGNVSYIFGQGGVKRAASQYGVPFLGEMPLAMSVREQGDAGVPLGVAYPDAPESAAYRAIAQQVLSGLPAPSSSYQSAS